MVSSAWSTPRPSAGARCGQRLVGVAGAVAAALLVWVAGEPVLGHELVVTQPGQEPRDLGAGAFAVFALLSSLAGWALLAVLERVTARARLIWTIVALLVLAVSFFPVAGIEATGGSKAVLALAHVAVAAVLIPMFRRTTAGRRAADERAAA
ncbi:DUF6069 family protein [Thermomonospora amylolytica]|uniref:DUF6069 family protein n=1 Tax=Thermomonospora amylolytica TaxID=1411117 RepID=UPI000E6D532F|nr:DUF6069 family protein [Thermomonospora amylolytica]